MRHERSATASGIDQMFFEGERKYYKVIDKETGKVLEWGDNSKSWVERDKTVITTHPVAGSGYFGIFPGADEGKSPRTYSLENVIVEGEIKVKER